MLQKKMLTGAIDRLSVEGAFTVLAKASELEKAGKSIIHMEIGEPDFKTPDNIVKAAVASLHAGETHYVPAVGLKELRETVASAITKNRGVPTSADEVIIAPGVKPLIFFAILSLIEPGDEVIIPVPAYPTYSSVVNFINGVPVPIVLHEEEDFRFDTKELEKKITPRTKMIVLNSPHNPTGGILTREDLEHVAFLSKKYDLYVLSDEIYSRIVYDEPHASYYSVPGVKERTILVDGFSKAYAMTGWRLGFGVMPKPLVTAMTKLTNNSTACTCAFVQRAGIEALNGPQDSVEKMVAEFRKRREIIVEKLNEVPGFKCRKPKGAFYAFPNIRGTKMKSRELAVMLLEKFGVGTLSGNAFGEAGEGYLRFSYANSISNIERGIQIIKEALS